MCTVSLGFLIFLTDVVDPEGAVLEAGWEGFSKLMNLSQESFEDQALPINMNMYP